MAVQIIKIASGYNSSAYREIMIDSEDDLALIDTSQVAPGSVAYTCESGMAAMDLMFMWNGQAWCEM